MLVPNNNALESSPYKIREGVFGATFNKNNASIYLRMELLVPENTKSWTRFREMNCLIAREVFTEFVKKAGTPEHVDYENAKKSTGFTSEEYALFTEKAVQIKKKPHNKIVSLLSSNSVGSKHMMTDFHPEELHYIVYATMNPNFSIKDVDTEAERTLKNYIGSYQDILISMGADFSAKNSFHNRGISRNPHWVFEEKYAGLSMILHGFSGVVAKEYFPEKELMLVRPIGSMQAIIQKSLLPDEGHIKGYNGKIELKTIECSSANLEGPCNYIKVSALTRIYNEAFNLCS